MLEDQRESFALAHSRRALVKLCNRLLPRDSSGKRIFERFGSHGVHLSHGNVDIVFNRYIRGDAIYVIKDGVIVGSWADQSAAYSFLGENDVTLSRAFHSSDLTPFLKAADITPLIVKLGHTSLNKADKPGDIAFEDKFKKMPSNSPVLSTFSQHARARLESDLSL